MARLKFPDLPDGPLRDLFTALHELHRHRGWPSTRAIAQDVGCSPMTISHAFSRPRLPSWGMLELIVEHLNGATADFHALWLAAGAAAGEPVPEPRPNAIDHWHRPAELEEFLVGRLDVLAEIDAIAALAHPVILIGGVGGCGKTALAWEYGLTRAADFPGGRLIIGMNGYLEGHRPRTRDEALAEMLRAIGAADQDLVGKDFATRLGMWRSRTGGQRMLLVLDNVRDVAEVRDLVVQDAACTVIVTSRDRLDLPGAHSIELDMLPHSDARTMFVTIAGAAHCRDAGLVDEAVRRCRRHPLQIRVHAARIPVKRSLPELVAELRVRPAGVVHESVALSYRDLDVDQRRLFRLLGAHPGPYLTVGCAAALTRIAEMDAMAILDSLVDARVISRHDHGRGVPPSLIAYAAHDLLREYAAGTAAAEADEHRAAIEGLLAHYSQALTVFNIDWRDSAVDLGRDEQAWVEVERPGIMACLDLTDPRPAVAALAQALDWPFRRLGFYQDARRAAELAELSCADAGDDLGRAYALWAQGDISRITNDTATAAARYRAAEAIYARLGDRAGLGHVARGLGHVALATGDHATAAGRFEEALLIGYETADLLGEAHSLSGLGDTRTAMGDVTAAKAHYRRALTIYREHDHHAGQSQIRLGLGRAALGAGEHVAAANHFRQALALARHCGDSVRIGWSLLGLGDSATRAGEGGASEFYREGLAVCRVNLSRAGQAHALRGLAALHEAAGRPASARRCLREARDLLLWTGSPEADEVLALLEERQDGD